jgi:hypothetical protein
MARDKVSYEWAVECVDEFDDVQDIYFADSYAEAVASQTSEAESDVYSEVRIALVRTEGNDDDGINWRGYSYVRDGALEPQFSTYHPDGRPANDGPDVPQRFHKEVATSPAKGN